MKPPTKIDSETQYNELLEVLCKRLIDSIPNSESPSVSVVLAPMPIRAQYGASAVVVRLSTNSSGVDDYIVYVDNNRHGQFIRTV